VLLAAWLKVYPQIHTYSQKKKEPKKKNGNNNIPIKELKHKPKDHSLVRPVRYAAIPDCFMIYK
jgi:hypothetical protein